MRDVKNRITRDLELFVDENFGIELLVSNQIINLNLPINLVYEQVNKQGFFVPLRGVLFFLLCSCSVVPWESAYLLC